MSVSEILAAHQQQVGAALTAQIDGDIRIPRRLALAMTHILQAGGKGVRGFLVIETARMFAVTPDQALPVAMAVEAMHAYSLIHDDLPAMDNSPLRRGRPTVHVVFDEATAILAGDALQAMAFSCLSQAEKVAAPARLALVASLAEAAGAAGMVGGQQMDIGGGLAGLPQLEAMQAMKTGALLQWSAVAGGTLAGASAGQIAALEAFGEHLGLLFQVTDDILDVVGHSDQTGKPTDHDRNKTTWVSLLGLDGARNKAAHLADQARAALASLPDAPVMTALVQFIVARSR